MPRALLLAMGAIMLLGTASAADPRLWPIEADGKFGAIDREGKVVVEPQYDEELRFSGGLARVSQNGKAGFVDASGNLVISPKKTISKGKGDFAAEVSVAALIQSDFAEGLAAYALDNRMGYVDTKGDIAIEAKFDEANPFIDGLAIVRNGSKFGWIDRTGAFVIPATWDKVSPFSDGLACVLTYDHGGYGYIDRKGRTVIEPQFNYAYPFVEGRARAQTKGGYGYIDKSGKVVVPPGEGYRLSSDFSDGRAPVNVSGKGWGYIDPSGEMAIPPALFGAVPFREGFARATLTGGVDGSGKWTQKKYGYIDRSGKFVVEPQFDDAADFSEGLAAVGVKGKGYGFVDTKGKLKVELKYAKADDFSGGLARVWDGNVQAYVDPDGREVWRGK